MIHSAPRMVWGARLWPPSMPGRELQLWLTADCSVEVQLKGFMSISQAPKNEPGPIFKTEKHASTENS